MSYPFKTGVSDSIIARLVLLANHVIASEPAATARLRPHAGRQMELRFNHQANWPLAQVVQGWLPTRVRLGVTPAGLLDWSPLPEGSEESPLAPGSLTITVQVPDPVNAVKLALKRERPEVSIDGDVAFAEAVSWLMKNLRWDLEDDLARWLGSTPTQMLKALADNVRAALARWRPGSGSGKMPGPFSR